jgi:dihydroorotate dehydrogenase electron transfer subunit
MAQSSSATVDVIAPLGRPFSLPREPIACLLVGFGAASAALIRLAEVLMKGGCRVTFLLLGAAPAFGVVEARRHSSHFEDLTAGAGRFAADAADRIATAAQQADVVYSAGPPHQVQQVAAAVAQQSVVHQTALEMDVVCGGGTCTTCAIPVRGRDGLTRMVRVCHEGPVFDATLVRWDDLGTVPPDCLGAPVDVTTQGSIA